MHRGEIGERDREEKVEKTGRNMSRKVNFSTLDFSVNLSCSPSHKDKKEEVR